VTGVGGAFPGPAPTPIEVRSRGPSAWVALGLFAAALVALVGLSLVGQSGGRPDSQAAVATPTATPTATSSPTAPPAPPPGTPPPRVAVSIGPTPTCPPGSTPDTPGPVNQARPPQGLWAMAFDRHAGQLVAITGDEGDETWTFDVCSNTWTRMHPNREPPGLVSLVYDIDSDVTIGSDSVAVWAYDLEANTWTEKGPFAPLAYSTMESLRFYDPVSGLVIALGLDHAEAWTYEVETGTWTPIFQANKPAGLGQRNWDFAHDASVDRFVAYQAVWKPAGDRNSLFEGNKTWLFDIRSGTWSETGAVTPEFIYGGWGNVPAIAYDEAAEQTVMLGQGHSAAYDATADRWETLNVWTSSADWLTTACGAHPECRQDQGMVYDPVNERLVVYGGAAIAGAGGEGGTAVDDVLAFDTRTRKWTVLLEASQPVTPGSPSPSPATYDLGLSVALIPVAADFSDPTDCTGTGEWADLHSGVDVIVTDAAGAIIGTAPLSKGAALGDPRYCRFEIRVGGLPELPSYTVKIGQHEYPGLVNFADIGHSTLVVP